MPSVAHPGGTFCCGEGPGPPTFWQLLPVCKRVRDRRRAEALRMGRGSTLERAALSSFSGQLWTGLGRRRSPCCLRVTWKVTGTGALPQPRPERRGPGPDPREHLLPAGSREADSTCDGHAQGEETTSAHVGFPRRGWDRTSWVWGPGFSCSGLCPRWRGRRQHTGAAPGSAAPAGRRGWGAARC